MFDDIRLRLVRHRAITFHVWQSQFYIKTSSKFYCTLWKTLHVITKFETIEKRDNKKSKALHGFGCNICSLQNFEIPNEKANIRPLSLQNRFFLVFPR